MKKPKINARSVPILVEIDRYVRKYNCRGRLITHAASDVCDSAFYRDELDDLIRRRLIEVIPDGEGSGPNGEVLDGRLCGDGWTVHLTDRAIDALWPDRRHASSN